MYPELTPMNKRKFVRLQNNFINYGSNLKAPLSLVKRAYLFNMLFIL